MVLNFWATWCLPCREEIPILVETKRQYGSRGVEIIAASADTNDARRAVQAFARDQSLNFPVWLGADVETMKSFDPREAPAGNRDHR